jgi:hypothetical protein
LRVLTSALLCLLRQSPRNGVYSAADDGASLAGRMLPPRACAQLAQLAPPLRAVLLEEASSFALETLPQSAPLLLDAETLPRLCAPHLDWLARGDAAQCAAAVAALAECEACHAQAVDWPTLSTHGCRMKVLSYCPCGTCPEPKPEAVRVYTGDRSAVCFDGCAHPLAERDSLPLWGLARRVSLQEVVGFIASACPAAPTCAPVLACKALTPRRAFRLRVSVVLSAIHNRLGEIPQHMDAVKLRGLLARISVTMRAEDCVASGAWATAEAALRAAPWPPRGTGPFSLAAARRARGPAAAQQLEASAAAGGGGGGGRRPARATAAAAADWVCASCGGLASASRSGAAAPVAARRCEPCAASEALAALPLPLPADDDD